VVAPDTRIVRGDRRHAGISRDRRSGRRSLAGGATGAGLYRNRRVANFVKWFGREPDLMLDFLDNRSWRDITATGWWINCRAKAGRKVVWSVPMLPNDGTSTLAQGAGGAYDDYFKQIAAALIAGGFRDAIIRVGWEFNADWFTWARGRIRRHGWSIGAGS